MTAVVVCEAKSHVSDLDKAVRADIQKSVCLSLVRWLVSPIDNHRLQSYLLS